MITNSNRAYFAKVPGCLVQEELIYLICQDSLGGERDTLTLCAMPYALRFRADEPFYG
jgi:hypothetical protein